MARRPHPNDRRMRVLTATPEGEAHIGDFLEPVLGPGERALAWISDADAELLERFPELLAGLKERGAAATPGPPAERAGDDYTPALLM